MICGVCECTAGLAALWSAGVHGLELLPDPRRDWTWGILTAILFRLTRWASRDSSLPASWGPEFHIIIITIDSIGQNALRHMHCERCVFYPVESSVSRTLLLARRLVLEEQQRRMISPVLLDIVSTKQTLTGSVHDQIHQLIHARQIQSGNVWSQEKRVQSQMCAWENSPIYSLVLTVQKHFLQLTKR